MSVGAEASSKTAFTYIHDLLPPQTSSPPLSLCRSDPSNTSTIYFCSTMTFSNFNDLNCEKNILHIPHFYHILSILDKLLSCELHYNVGCLTPPHITSHENCCHPLLCKSPFFLFQKTV